MNRSINLWQFVGFAVATFVGTLLHFLYDWTGGAVWAALISGVNESTWEHMKLLFFPMLLFAFIQRPFFSDRPDYWCIKLRGTLLGLVLIPVLFYTYNGAIGPSPDWLNITIFFVAAAAAYFAEARLFKMERTACQFPRAALALLWLIAGLFVLFTFLPPEIGLFRDPLTGIYGI